jgi:hypothetical protein
MRILGPLLVAVNLMAVSCSQGEEQCRALVLAMTEADGGYVELSRAAARGNRPKFEQATRDFDAALAKLSAVELSGSGLRAEERAFQRKRYLDNAPKVVPAYRRLLEAVEKNPDLGKKHMDGVAYLGSLDDLPKEVEDADRELEVAGRLTRDTKCE